MTSTQSLKLLGLPSGQLDQAQANIEAWARRRPWTRTDTARHLNDRSEPLLAVIRRAHPQIAAAHTRQAGYWLKVHAPALFDRAHKRLAAATNDDVRANILPTDLIT
jgi:hypothetical protein